MPKDFLKVVSRPIDLLRALRQVAFGSLVAGAGVALTDRGVHAAESTPRPSAAVSPTIVDRSKKAAKLILRLPNGTSAWVAQHRSHRSHSSHYSSSSGSSAPPPPVTRSPPAAAPVRSIAPESGATTQSLMGEIQSIDKVKRTFVIKIGVGVTKTFAYRDDTKYETSVGGSLRFDEFADANDGGVPIAVGNKVQVTFKTSADGKTSTATVILWKLSKP